MRFVCPTCGLSQPGAGYCAADGSALVETIDPLLGAEIGRYRIARLLGEGGMGAVYLGVQPMIGSRVAVKVLSAECARTPDLLERFFAEARSVNLIRHENIVSVLDLAQLPDGRPYIVMEFIEGRTLGQIVRGLLASGERVPLGGIVQVVTEMLSALGAAHALGIVHRDLKPDNVLVTAEGHAKVLDFGIAKLAPGLNNGAHQQSPRTRTGALLGTPAYMAPEQISGRGTVDARTDIYAAGVVLFEAATGTQPFAGETLFDLMRAHLEQPPPSPRARRPELPVAFEHVILTALEKDPARRFQTASAMAQALRHAANELPGDAWRALSGKSLAGGRISAEHLRPPTPTTPMDLGRGPTHLATPVPSPREAERTVKSPPNRRALYGAIAAITAIGVVVSLIVLGGGSGTAGGANGAAAGSSLLAEGTGASAGTAASASATGTASPGAAATTPASAPGTASAGAAATTPASAPGTASAGAASAGVAATTPASAPGTTGSTPASATGTGPTTTTRRAPTSGTSPAGAPPTGTAMTGQATTGPATTGQATTGQATTAPAGPTIVGGGSAADHGVHVGPGVTMGPNVIIGSNPPTASGSNPPTASAPKRTTVPFTGNAKRFDAKAYLPKALAMARTIYSDAGFARMDVPNVFPTGLADLTIGDDVEAEFYFRSPSHSARPAGIPKNQDVEIVCYVEVTVSAREVTVRSRDLSPIDSTCSWPIRPLPRCSLAGVWAKAITQGADKDTIAKLAFLSDGEWFFDNDSDGYEGMTRSLADSCP